MSNQDVKSSDVVEIAKRNGDFRRNYGLIIGAFVYLSTVRAARHRSFWWKRLLVAACGTAALLHSFGITSFLSRTLR